MFMLEQHKNYAAEQVVITRFLRLNTPYILV